MKKVITYGTYDLLHYGHIRLLERAKALGDYLIVGVTADDFDKMRGKINVQQPLMERVESIRATGLADEIIIEEYEGQKIDDIRRYDVNVFAIGSDWAGQFDYLKEYCEVVYLERTQGVSSSEIRSQKRQLRIGVCGSLAVKKKFITEGQYVNGVIVQDCDDDFSDVDAVYIASMPQCHYADVKRALESNKHVICESPIAICEKDYQELRALAAERNLVLMDAIKTAYSMAYNRLLLLAKSGKIGNIVSVDAVCTSLQNKVGNGEMNFTNEQNTICGWGPTAMLPIFQLLGTEYRSKRIVTKILDDELRFDGFTKIDFLYSNAVASIKIAKAAKAEGQLVITGTKGYIFVPAPWWKTDYFEVRFENQTENRRYFYQLDGDGIRYEIVTFLKAVESGKHSMYIGEDITTEIIRTIQSFYNGEYEKI